MGYYSDFLGTLRSSLKIAKVTIDTSGATVARTLSAPDKSGTIACLSDISGASSSGSGSATIDFGGFPGSNEASVVVTGLTAILASASVTVFVKSDSTSSSHSAKDHSYLRLFAALSTNTATAGTGFTISARSAEKLQGGWTISYIWRNP